MNYRHLCGGREGSVQLVESKRGSVQLVESVVFTK
jgi:hypothetical protein